jgi:serine protease Do
VGQRPGTGPGTTGGRSRPIAVLVGALLLVAVVSGAAPASADDGPKPLTSRRLFDQSRPGVQLITVRFSAGLVVPEPTVTEANGRALDAIVASRIRRGEIPATQVAASGAIVDELARDPFRWLTASSRVHRTNVRLAATGSGFSITPDGYIVTNAHVVAPKSDDITAAFLARDLREEGDDFIAGFRQDGLSEAQATRFLNAMVRWATRNARLANFKRTISVVGSTGAGSSGSSERRTAKLVAAGEEFPGKDVAVLKVHARNMATVPLGDDGALSTGDRLFVLGFPGAATFNPVLSKDSQEEPTLTQGVLSAKKRVKGGYTVLQTDAGMTHGNSGGPVLDEQGKVVGIATLGSVDPTTGREVSGLNFAVPASIVNELLRDAGVRASEGAAGRAYRQALDAFDRQWYKRTLPLLERVKTLDPGHPLVAKLIKDTQTAIAQGRDRTPREVLGLPILVAGGLAGAVVVAGVGGGLLATRSRRRRRQRRQLRGQAFEPAPQAAVAGNGWGTAVPQQPATQPLDLPAPAAGARNEEWWQSHQPRQPLAPSAPTAPMAPVTPTAPVAPGPPAVPTIPVTEDGDGYGSGYGYGDNRNGAWAPPPPRPAPTALQSWWRAEEAQTAEAPDEPRPRPQREGSSGLVCWNCGRHNHPSLRYCEQCWTVLG